MDQQEILRLLQSGLNSHQTARLDDAEAAYRKVLAVAPANPDGLHLLGVLEAQRGRLESGAALLAVGQINDAIEQLRIAAQLLPTNAAVVGNYGYGLSRAGKHT